MTQLTLEMPEEVFATLRKSPQEFTHKLRIAAAVKWYELELVSQGRAAEIAGLTRAEFITALGKFQEAVTPRFPGVDADLCGSLPGRIGCSQPGREVGG